MIRKGITREVTFLTLPIILAAGLGFFFWNNANKSPRFIKSPVLVDKVFWTDDGRILAYKIYFDRNTRTRVERFFSWKSENGELLADINQSKGYTSFSPSLDNKIWAASYDSLGKIGLLDPSQGFNLVGQISEDQKNSSFGNIFWISSDKILDIRAGLKKESYHKVVVWNTKTGKEVKQDSERANRAIPFLQSEGVHNFILSPDHKYALVQSTLKSNFLFGQAGSKVSLISWPECRVIKQFNGDLWPTISWSRDGKKAVGLVTTMASNVLVKADIYRFDLSTKKEEFKSLDILPIQNDNLYIGHPHTITDARFSPDTRFLLVPVIIREKQSLKWKWKVFSVITGKECGEISQETKPDFVIRPWVRMNFSPDGQYLLQPVEKGIEIWDMNQFAVSSEP